MAYIEYKYLRKTKRRNVNNNDLKVVEDQVSSNGFNENTNEDQIEEDYEKIDDNNSPVESSQILSISSPY